MIEFLFGNGIEQFGFLPPFLAGPLIGAAGKVLGGIFGGLGKRQEARAKEAREQRRAARLQEVADLIKGINPAAGLASQQAGATQQLLAQQEATGVTGSAGAAAGQAALLGDFNQRRTENQFKKAEALRNVFSDQSFAGAKLPGEGATPGTGFGSILTGALGTAIPGLFGAAQGGAFDGLFNSRSPTPSREETDQDFFNRFTSQDLNDFSQAKGLKL